MSARKNKQLTVVFSAIDASNRPSRKSGITYLTGSAQVSQDGSSYATTTNTPSEIDTTGRYKLTLVASEMNGDFVSLKVSQTGSNVDDIDLYFPTFDVSGAAGSVWDTPRATHATAATFGEGVASVQGNLTGSVLGSVAYITGNLNGNVLGSVAYVTGNLNGNVLGSVAYVSGNINGNVLGSVAYVTGNLNGSVLGSVATVTALAAGAIASASLSQGAVNAIVSGTWDAAQSGHQVSSSLGASLYSASLGSPAATIAAAVWNEPRSGHTTGGTFGEGVSSVQGNLTGTVLNGVSHVSGNINGNVLGSVATVTSLAAGAVASGSLSQGAINAIVSGTWDAAQLGHTVSASLGASLFSASLGSPASTIAAAVWNEARSGHTTAGTFGEGVASVQGNLTGSVLGGVSYVTGNLNGNVLGSVATVTSLAAGAIASGSLAQGAVNAIVSGTWDAPLNGHLISGTTGATIYSASLGSPAATIAAAVWDTTRAAHTTGGTFGEGVTSVQGNLTGSVLGSVGSIAAAGILSASFAQGGIDAVAAGVWDAPVAAHAAGAGSFGQTLSNLSASIDLTWKIENGSWTITGSQMLFYASGSNALIATFNLQDINGVAIDPTTQAPFRRVRV